MCKLGIHRVKRLETGQDEVYPCDKEQMTLIHWPPLSCGSSAKLVIAMNCSQGMQSPDAKGLSSSVTAEPALRAWPEQQRLLPEAQPCSLLFIQAQKKPPVYFGFAQAAHL